MLIAYLISHVVALLYVGRN
uniref:Uncharacterized protein n=1 Tax=Arundo donax TaxID=35708 RepID=A0A0A9BQ57_ARUDO